MKSSRRQALGAIAGLYGAALPQRVNAGGLQLPIRLAVLDVGGTIVEERGDVPEALAGAFEKRGITVSSAEINQWRGAAKREVVRHFVTQHTKVTDAERDKLIEAVYTDFSARIVDSYKTVKGIPGAEDAFRALQKMGLTLATSTGFDGSITSSIMKRLGWERYFVAQVTSDDVVQGRPSPYMLFHAMEAARVNGVSQVIAVGDTPLDLQAGANGGMRGVVGVLSGAGTRTTMEPEPHTDLIDSVAALARAATCQVRRDLAASREWSWNLVVAIKCLSTDKIEQVHKQLRAASLPFEVSWISREMRPISELCTVEEAHRQIQNHTLAHLNAAPLPPHSPTRSQSQRLRRSRRPFPVKLPWALN